MKLSSKATASIYTFMPLLYRDLNLFSHAITLEGNGSLAGLYALYGELAALVGCGSHSLLRGLYCDLIAGELGGDLYCSLLAGGNCRLCLGGLEGGVECRYLDIGAGLIL